MKCPSKYVKEDFVMRWPFYLECPKIEGLQAGHVYSFEMSNFQYTRNIRNVSFSESERKNGAFPISRAY